MASHRFFVLALALLALATLASAVMAGVAVLGMTLTPSIAAGALALLVVLATGVVLLHQQLREARWDAGYRLR